MFRTGKNLITFEPGCDFARNRSFGLRFFRFALIAILLIPAPGRTVMAWQQSRKPIVSAYVGAVFTEEFSLENASTSVDPQKPTVTPAGSAEVHVSQVVSKQKVHLVMRLRFLRPGRCSIRLPKSWDSGSDGPDLSNVRVFDVRPWPMREIAARDSVRAGVGPLMAVLEASSGNGELLTGDPVTMRLTLTGAAAMAVEDPPELSIVSSEPSGTGDARIDRPLVVERSVDWGDSVGRTLGRTWLYEWRAREPGAYRVRPLRFSHLDESGRVQTKLVTGPAFDVRPRPLFRASEESGEVSFRNQRAIERNSLPGAVAGGVFVFGILAGLVAIATRFRIRGRLLAWSLQRRLRASTSPERALAAWRSIEPAWRACRHYASSDSIKEYEELRRRAFGPPPSDS